MVKRFFYTVATTVLVGGVAYAIFMNPRPCRGDDVLYDCGSGARASAVITAVFFAWLLSYVGSALGERNR